MAVDVVGYRNELEECVVLPETVFLKRNKSNDLFLHCFNRLYKVSSTDRNRKSFGLSFEQKELVKILFEKLLIPFKEEIDFELCLVDADRSERSNSTVVFEIDKETYKITNYNSFLIKYKQADLIRKALNKKSIESTVETYDGRG